MSKALDIAELIRTRLITAPAAGEISTPLDITGLDVLVYKQKKIQSEIDTAIAKARGTAVVILWQGFATLDKNAARPRLAQTYTITVWSKPIIAGDNLPADDVMESIVNRLWQWVPLGKHAHGEAEIRDGGLVADTKFLKYDCEVIIPSSY